MTLERAKPLLRTLLAVMMVLIGVMHFVRPGPFIAIVPSFLPAPALLVYVSGFFEIAGGVGLLLPRTRKAAGWGLIALYLAVFPANINMAVNDIGPEGTHLSPILLWGRLPFQVLFVAWAWWMTRDDRPAAATR